VRPQERLQRALAAELARAERSRFNFGLGSSLSFGTGLLLLLLLRQKLRPQPPLLTDGSAPVNSFTSDYQKKRAASKP
jgi:hypothetical protein